MSHVARFSALFCFALGLAAPTTRAQTGDVPPTAAPALLKWLQAGAYKAWPKESAPHRSMGAHQTLVLTYISPALDKSLAGKAAAHPKGAAAVKELLDATGKPAGWAVSVKTSADSDGGKGWYWFEVLGSAAGSPTTANGNGVSLCVGCHARGRDAVLTEHPLD
jgi:hypothetical protein